MRPGAVALHLLLVSLGGAPVTRRLDLALGLALLLYTAGLAVLFLCDDAPMHALQELGIAAVIAWFLPASREP